MIILYKVAPKNSLVTDSAPIDDCKLGTALKMAVTSLC